MVSNSLIKTGEQKLKNFYFIYKHQFSADIIKIYLFLMG
jgi:hypothetical protein